MFINLLKPYYFYQLLKNIKNNRFYQVKYLIEKYFENSFNQYFLEYSCSYSYDCFRYFYLRLKRKNDKNWHLIFNYYRKINLKRDLNLKELEKIFNYKFLKKEEDFCSETKLNRLRHQIIKELIKRKKYSTIRELILNLNNEDKEIIFTLYFNDISIVVETELKEIIDIFSITKQFYNDKMFSTYGIDINKSQYDFLQKNYNFESRNWESYFLKTENVEIIEDIVKKYDLSLKTKIEKLRKSLLLCYEYKETHSMIDTINLFQKLDILTEENIIKSYKNESQPVYIDYHYLPLLNIGKNSEKEILKQNLKLILMYGEKAYHEEAEDKEKLLNVESLLDSYFIYISKTIDIERDNEFIIKAIKETLQISEEIGLYFYDNFHDFFMNEKHLFFEKILNTNKVPDKILKRIINEKDDLKKENLIGVIVKKISENYYYHNNNNKIYFTIKDTLTRKFKEILLSKKINEREALPILIDILEEDYFKNQKKINELFADSVGYDVSNALYFVDHYVLDEKSLIKGFLNLSYYNVEEIHINLAKKILEKEVNLSQEDEKSLYKNNIELYKLYQSYALNKKLTEKLQPKINKTKKLKI